MMNDQPYPHSVPNAMIQPANHTPFNQASDCPLAYRPDPSFLQAAAERRQRLAAAIRAQGGGVVVLWTAPEVMRNRDSDYLYRWDSYFYYLTAFPEPEACLVMVVDEQGHRAHLFCREKHAEREIWDGFRYGPDLAASLFGFDALPNDSQASIDHLDEAMISLLANQPALYTALAAQAQTDERVRQWFAKLRRQARQGVVPPQRCVDVLPLLDDMRLFKDAYELDCMRTSGRIAALAHRAAMRVSAPGVREYAVEAALLQVFREHGADAPAYTPIVAGGAQACILHYRHNRAELQDGDLLLIDAGCEWQGYASDITRTFPVNGRFSGPQRDVYEVVLAAQAAAIDQTIPGVRFDAVHMAAVRVLAQGLIDLGLCQGSVDGVIESGDYKRFYMHRTSHWLGMDVHDCGEYREPGEPDQLGELPSQAAGANSSASPNPSSNDTSRILRPDMVLTIEPGLYIRPGEGVDPRFANIGIRIEDDIRVTPTGPECLSADAPKTIAEIEAWMAKG